MHPRVGSLLLEGRVHCVHVAHVEDPLDEGHVEVVVLVRDLRLGQRRIHEATLVRGHLEVRLHDRVTHRAERVHRAHDLDLLLAVVPLPRDDVIGARIQHHLHHLVLARLPLEVYPPLALEVEHHAPRLGHLAPPLVHRVAHIGDRPVHVVGESLDHQAHSAHAVCLIGDVLVVRLVLVRRLVDVAVDDVLGHVGLLGNLQDVPEVLVGHRVGPARLDPASPRCLSPAVSCLNDPGGAPPR
mmetsp:Transcript_1852/g.6648  ORF Transcript_1852/g.6648 Transcript_1852/m.6648 type:complete len:241 (+) Transcript_1852:111-833(+)